MILTTKHLILRQPKIKDAKDIIEGINNLNISKWLLVVPYPYTMKDARWYINHCAEKNKQKKKDSYSFSIELKSEKKIIGGCGISKIDNHSKTAELGYWLNENYWRQGLITEAINVLIEFASKKLKLRRLTIPAYSDNKASNALAKSLGFKYEGRLRKVAFCKATGKIHDENVYGLLKEEWKKRLK